MSIYKVDNINEENIDNNTNDILDNLLEQCDNMLSVIEENTAAQKHYHTTQKDAAEVVEDLRKSSKIASAYLDHQDKKLSDPRKAEKMAYQVGKRMHSGEIDKGLDRGAKIGKKIVGKDNYDEKEADQYLYAFKSGLSAGTGNLLARAKRLSPDADIKGAYDRGAAKGDEIAAKKKKAIKETCLSILSIIDEL